jgi:hypothetical protein
MPLAEFCCASSELTLTGHYEVDTGDTIYRQRWEVDSPTLRYLDTRLLSGWTGGR